MVRALHLTLTFTFTFTLTLTLTLEVAKHIFSRIEPLVPKYIDGKQPVGCSPNIRLYRYCLGQRFGKHVDDSVYDEALQARP